MHDDVNYKSDVNIISIMASRKRKNVSKEFIVDSDDEASGVSEVWIHSKSNEV